MTLEQMKALVKVVEAGSFTRAADVLGMERSNVSRMLAQLEAELGVTLLERTTRRQSVTEVGRTVYERAVGVLTAMQDIVDVTQQMKGQPQGHLRVACGVEFGMGAVASWIEAYLARFPEVTAEAEFATRDVDLVHEGFDLAVCAGPLPESRLSSRRLGQFEYGLFASPAYVQRQGSPASPAELAAHQWVEFHGDGLRRGLVLHHPALGRSVSEAGASRLVVNAGAAACSAVLAGLGIGRLPVMIASDLVAQGRLLRVLAPWHPPAVTVHAVYPSNRYLAPKVRAFVDLALEQFPQSANP